MADEERVRALLSENRVAFAAAVGGICGVVVGFPFDTIKTRMQTYGYADMGTCTRQTYAAEGVRGFFRGIGPPLFFVSVLKATGFHVFETSKSTISQLLGRPPVAPCAPTPLSIVMAAGVASGGSVSLITCPLELVKINMQLARLRALRDGIVLPTTNLGMARQIVTSRGVSGLYIGFPLHLFRETVGTAIYFGAYEGQFKLFGYERATAPTWFHMMAGGLAGMASWCSIFPVDLIKSRVQKDAASSTPAFSRTWGYVLHAYKDAGIRGFYRGLQATMVRAFPIHAVNFFVYERALNVFAPH